MAQSKKGVSSGFGRLLQLMAVPRPQAPKEYTRPATEEAYKKALDEQGFIVPEKIDDVDLTQFPTVMADLEILEKYLMPVFWEFNQKATHYQSRYYYYQRIFLVAALLTTLISVLNSYIHGLPDSVVNARELLGLPLPDAAQLNLFLGICTAIISARASYYTLLANYGEPRQRWGQYRRLTEELRIIYFRFLAHLDVFSGPKRVDTLRREVHKLRREATQDG